MSNITINPGETFTVAPNVDCDRAIRIQNAAFVAEPRWLTINIGGGGRERHLRDLISALTELRGQR